MEFPFTFTCLNMEGTSSNICHRFIINEQCECIKLVHANMTAARDPKLFWLTNYSFMMKLCSKLAHIWCVMSSLINHGGMY